MKCKFRHAWRPLCNKPANTSGFCTKHYEMKCSVSGCKNHATKECDATLSLVCGYPLCDIHDHANHTHERNY